MAASRKTSSDTLKLRRLINNLKESGSELGVELEGQAGAFFSGVQIVTSKEKTRAQEAFSSDEEDGGKEGDRSEIWEHTNFLTRQRSVDDGVKREEEEKRKQEELDQELMKEKLAEKWRKRRQEEEEMRLEEEKRSRQIEQRRKEDEKKRLKEEEEQRERMKVIEEKRREEERIRLKEIEQREYEEEQKRLTKMRSEEENKRLQIEKRRVEKLKRKQELEQLQREGEDIRAKQKLEEEERERTRELRRKEEELNAQMRLEAAKKKFDLEEKKRHEDLLRREEREKRKQAVKEKQRDMHLWTLRKRKGPTESAREKLGEIGKSVDTPERLVETCVNGTSFEDDELRRLQQEAETEELRLTEMRIKELQSSISTLDWQLERVNIEKMKQKTVNIKKRMSITDFSNYKG